MKELAGERRRRNEKWARHNATCATKPIIPRENRRSRRSRYINHMSRTQLNVVQMCAMSYLRTPHMLEKTARELRSIDRSPPAMTASANGMMISGTNGPMHLSMTLRFSSCASFTSHNTAYELLLLITSDHIARCFFFRFTVLRLFWKSVVYVYSIDRTRVSSLGTFNNFTLICISWWYFVNFYNHTFYFNSNCGLRDKLITFCASFGVAIGYSR